MSGTGRKYVSGAQKRKKKVSSALASVEGVSKLTTFFTRTHDEGM